MSIAHVMATMTAEPASTTVILRSRDVRPWATLVPADGLAANGSANGLARDGQVVQTDGVASDGRNGQGAETKERTAPKGR